MHAIAHDSLREELPCIASRYSAARLIEAGGRVRRQAGYWLRPVRDQGDTPRSVLGNPCPFFSRPNSVLLADSVRTEEVVD